MTQAFNLSQLANGVNTSGQLNIATYVTGTLPSANLPTVPVDKGGTGQTTYTNGQLLIGNTTGNTLTKATLTAGTNITITNGAGAITIDAAGGSPTTAQVLTATAGATANSVGTYAWLQSFNNGAMRNQNFNTNIAGSSFSMCSFAFTSAQSTGAGNSNNANALSGTWKLMGADYANNSNTGASLFLRIS
jgi:hypothetical protein